MDPDVTRSLSKALKGADASEHVQEFLLNAVQFMDSQGAFSETALPEADQSVCVAFSNPKTAALVYDRVWAANPFATYPEEIRLWGGSKDEVQVVVGQALFTILNVARASDTSPVSIDEEEWSKVSYALLTWATPSVKRFQKRHPGAIVIFHTGDTGAAHVSKALKRTYGLRATPIYQTLEARDLSYVAGDYAALSMALTNMEFVDENSLEWDQVIQLRSDSNAHNKYRRLIHWLDREMVGKPLSYIQEELAIRLDDYHWALNKHGIQTTLGMIEGLLDPKFLVPSAGASATVALFTDPWLGLLSQGLQVGAKLSVDLGRHLIKREDLTRGAEIAWVYELQKGTAK